MKEAINMVQQDVAAAVQANVDRLIGGVPSYSDGAKKVDKDILSMKGIVKEKQSLAWSSFCSGVKSGDIASLVHEVEMDAGGEGKLVTNLVLRDYFGRMERKHSIYNESLSTDITSKSYCSEADYNAVSVALVHTLLVASRCQSSCCEVQDREDVSRALEKSLAESDASYVYGMKLPVNVFAVNMFM
jgi:hypothetical protein